MIPKKIHFCWFGGEPLPAQAIKCIDSWKKFCPEFEIIEWNETNFDVFQNQYCKDAYLCKKWAFVTDYVRLKVLFEHGGIYMDTDVEVCKSLTPFAEYSAWFGFESENKISTGIIASEARNAWIDYLLSYYDNARFINKDGTHNLTTNVEIITRMTVEKYNVKLNNTFQIVGENCALFPFDYFCAKDLLDGKVKLTDNTHTIHHFSGSWMNYKGRLKTMIRVLITRYFGKETTKKIKNLYGKIKKYD